MTSIFMSYARGDDGEPFKPNASFVARLHRDLKARGFDVWFDRVSLPSRSLTFHQEIRDAIAQRDRMLLVVGPQAAASEYVRQEWEFAYFEAEKIITPVLRQGDFSLIPDELKLLHCEDFREDARYEFHLEQLVRLLNDPVPPLGKLIGVPSLPPHYLSRAERLIPLRDAVRSGLDGSAPLGGATTQHQSREAARTAQHVGLHGMGGIGKSVLANLLIHDRKIREAFPDGIVWVGLGSLPTLVKLMRDVHRGLGGDGAFGTEYEGKARLRELLADKAALLVLDDAWRRSDVDAFDVLGPRCRAIITTRDAGLLTSLGGSHHVVELLTDGEALRLLAVSLGKEVDELPADATSLLKECGRLPLAVALAGGMIAAGMPWRDMIDALQHHELEFLSDEHRPDQHQDLWKMIEVSVAALQDDEQQRLTELAVFPEDEAVPSAAVGTLWESSSGLSMRQTRKLLVRLTQRSLVQFTPPQAADADGLDRLSTHGLIHDYCVRRAQVMLGGISILHENLLAAYRTQCEDGWASGPNDGYFFNHLRDHLVATGRGIELVDLLDAPHWLEAKLAIGLGYDLLKDFADAQVAADASTDRSDADRDAVESCALVGRLLANVIDFVQIEPSSVSAQLLLEFQEHSPEELPAFRSRWEAANRNRPWLERHGAARRHTVPYIAQTAQRQAYLHSLSFSADGRLLLYFDREGTAVRWDWETGGQSRTEAPAQCGFARSAAVPSNQEILLTDETAVYLLRVADLWHADLAESKWLVLHRAEPGHHLRALASCPQRGYAVFADDGETQGQLFQFRKGADGCELAWRSPHAGSSGPLTNHIAFGDEGKLRAIGFGSGDLAVNTGFHGRAHQGGLYEAVFLTGRGLLATVGNDGILALWDVRRGLVQRRDLLFGAAECVDYCPAADLLAVGHRTGAVTLLKFNGDNLSEEVLHPGVRGWVLCVRFSPCGRYLAVSGRSGAVRLFDVAEVLEELSCHAEILRRIPQGPIEQASYLLPADVGLFLDQNEILYSTGPNTDSRHLPQKCETFCAGPEKGPVVLLPGDVRFLDPSSGRPRHIHPLPESSRLASLLSPREDMLAVLEPDRLVVYALGNPDSPPEEVCAASLAELRAATGVDFSTQRNAIPLCFCDDGQTVALPLEPICRSSMSTDRVFSSPPLDHRLCFIEVATGRLLWSIPYRGFCNALVGTPSRRAVALGTGTGRVHLFDATDQQLNGSMFLPSEDPGVLLLALDDGQVVGRLPLLAADDGVSALSSDPNGLLLVGCRSGRVRAASLHDNRWLASVVLPAPVLGFAHQGSALRFHAIDDGSTVGNWPVIHELLLRLPPEPPGSSGGSP